jgi:transketolase
VLSRQNIPILDRGQFATAEGLRRGAYVLADAPQGKPDVVLIGTGSEVSLTVAAREKLAESKIQARVVSMPSWELFDAQPREYRDTFCCRRCGRDLWWRRRFPKGGIAMLATAEISSAWSALARQRPARWSWKTQLHRG